MSVAVSLPTGDSLVPAVVLRRFAVDEYHRMIQAGIFTEDEPLELLGGWIVNKMPRNPRHDATVHLVSTALSRVLPPGWQMRIQSAITTEDSEPEPDLAVVRGSPRDFLERHPGPGEVGLLIEVADSSLDHDRTLKSRVYAQAGVPWYWIVNLTGQCIEAYSDPTGSSALPAYGTRRDYFPGEAVPLMLDGLTVARIPTADLLP